MSPPTRCSLIILLPDCHTVSEESLLISWMDGSGYVHICGCRYFGEDVRPFMTVFDALFGMFIGAALESDARETLWYRSGMRMVGALNSVILSSLLIISLCVLPQVRRRDIVDLEYLSTGTARSVCTVGCHCVS